ncbi:MAG TPA: hypothetical protein VL326_37555 [Kofleriaceae bacterium]|nr:hypothetical protein [Kofleriaceae bacterium]
MRIFVVGRYGFAGTYNAARGGMRPEETWTIPLHIIMWTTLAVGLIMALAVVMMH